MSTDARGEQLAQTALIPQPPMPQPYPAEPTMTIGGDRAGYFGVDTGSLRIDTLPSSGMTYPNAVSTEAYPSQQVSVPPETPPGEMADRNITNYNLLKALSKFMLRHSAYLRFARGPKTVTIEQELAAVRKFSAHQAELIDELIAALRYSGAI